MGWASEAPRVPSPLGAAAQGVAEGGVSACDELGGGSRIIVGGMKRLELGPAHGCPGGNCDLSPSSKKKREANKFVFSPINPEIQRDLKSRVGGRQFEGGKGVPDRRGDGRGSLLSVSSPRPGSSVLAAGSRSGSWGHKARGEDPPASGTGAAGAGAERRAARGQVANWIRERGGESPGRGGELGRGARAARAANRGSCPHRRPPSLPAPPAEKRLPGRARRLPRRRFVP